MVKPEELTHLHLVYHLSLFNPFKHLSKMKLFDDYLSSWHFHLSSCQK